MGKRGVGWVKEWGGGVMGGGCMDWGSARRGEKGKSQRINIPLS